MFSTSQKKRQEELQAQNKVLAHASKLHERLSDLTSQELAIHEEKMDVMRQLKLFKITSLKKLSKLAKEL